MNTHANKKLRKIRIVFVITVALCLGLLPGCEGPQNKQTAPPKPIVLETEQYPKQIGYEITDSGSSGKKARVSFSQTGLVVWGQYLTLPEGDYTAEFRVKVGDLPPTKEPVLALSVTSGGVTKIGVTENLALKTLTGKQLVPAYRYTTIPLRFHSKGDTDLEFRVQVLNPEVFVWSDYVKVLKRK